MSKKDGLVEPFSGRPHPWQTYCQGPPGWRGMVKRRTLWSGRAWRIGDTTLEGQLPEAVRGGTKVILTERRQHSSKSLRRRTGGTWRSGVPWLHSRAFDPTEVRTGFPQEPSDWDREYVDADPHWADRTLMIPVPGTQVLSISYEADVTVHDKMGNVIGRIPVPEVSAKVGTAKAAGSSSTASLTATWTR